MRPETEQYLQKAYEDLSDAQAILDLGLAKVAARSAYYAVFHAAEAVIFERSGKIAKTHTGVRSEFGRVCRDLAGIDPDFQVFLAHAYKFKEISDYGVGDRAVVDAADAKAAVVRATEMITSIDATLRRSKT